MGKSTSLARALLAVARRASGSESTAQTFQPFWLSAMERMPEPQPRSTTVPGQGCWGSHWLSQPPPGQQKAQ